MWIFPNQKDTAEPDATWKGREGKGREGKEDGIETIVENNNDLWPFSPNS